MAGLARTAVGWVPILVFAFVASLAVSLAAPPATAGDAEELVIELRAGRLASQTLLARTEGGLIYIPARALFELVEIRADIDSTGHLAARREPQGIAIEVDFTRQSAKVGTDVIPQEAAPMFWRDGELYLGTPLIARLFDLRVDADFGELMVTLDPADDLPVGRRIARERARSARRAGESAALPDRLVVPRPEPIAGAGLDWGLAMPDFTEPATATYDLRFGTGFIGGAFDLRHRGNAGGARLNDPLTASWVRAWPEGWLPRQLRLGWVASTGPHARALRGVAASTAPYSRPAAFGEAVVRGWLGPGWDVELYRNGELIDYVLTDPSGYYEFTSPVDYGSNPVEVRAFGPNGEVRELARSIPIAAARLPAGAIEAEASLGACDGPQCAGLANLDARCGFTENWTLRGGTDFFLRDGSSSLLVHPYTMVSGVVLDSWLVQADAVGGAVGALELGYEPSPDLRASVRHEIFDTRIEAPILTTPGQLSRTRVTGFYRPDPRRRALFLTFGAQHVRSENDAQSRISLGLSGQARNVRLSLEGRAERFASDWSQVNRRFVGVNASTALRARPLRFLGGIFLRGQLEWELGRGALERAGLVLGKNAGPLSRLELNASWSHSAGTSVSLGISAIRPGVRSTAQVVRGPRGGVTATAFAEGAVLWNDAARRVEVAAHRSIGRGGVSGLVFLDDNANGWRDPGEEVLPDVRVLVAWQAVKTDPTGRYTVWDLGPFEDAEVTIDPESLPSPLLVPTVALACVTVEPNGFREVNLPIVNGAEAAGLVTREGTSGVAGVGGLRVILTHLGTGRRHEAMTFHDGTFYVLGLLPGDYSVALPADVLAALRLEMEGPAVRFTVPADPDLRVPEVEIHLVPAARQAR